MTQTFCPKHFTLEDIDCEEPIVACPPRIPLDPAKHVIVTCGPCDRTRVVPVDRIMKGSVQATGQCQLSECAAVVMPVELPPLLPVDPTKRGVVKSSTGKRKPVTE